MVVCAVNWQTRNRTLPSSAFCSIQNGSRVTRKSCISGSAGRRRYFAFLGFGFQRFFRGNFFGGVGSAGTEDEVEQSAYEDEYARCRRDDDFLVLEPGEGFAVVLLFQRNGLLFLVLEILVFVFVVVVVVEERGVFKVEFDLLAFLGQVGRQLFRIEFGLSLRLLTGFGEIVFELGVRSHQDHGNARPL